jgi:lysophospholipase L1-like esterase
MRYPAVLLFAVPILAALAAAQPAPPPELRVQAERIDPKLPTIFIAGDSTAAPDGGPIMGWGVPFARYFNPQRMNVVNRSRAGRSSRTFETEGLWDQLAARLKPGDIVLIQFGHNDPGPINDDRRARGSLPGLGEESQAIDNRLTHRPEVVRTFGHYERDFIASTRAHGAIPVLLSPTVRNIWKNGRIELNMGHYREWTAELARREHVDYIDFSHLAAARFEALGEKATGVLFPRDHTHTGPQGADLNAAVAVAGLKAVFGPGFSRYLSSPGQAVPEAAPQDVLRY